MPASFHKDSGSRAWIRIALPFFRTFASSVLFRRIRSREFNFYLIFLTFIFKILTMSFFVVTMYHTYLSTSNHTVFEQTGAYGSVKNMLWLGSAWTSLGFSVLIFFFFFFLGTVIPCTYWYVPFPVLLRNSICNYFLLKDSQSRTFCCFRSCRCLLLSSEPAQLKWFRFVVVVQVCLVVQFFSLNSSFLFLPSLLLFPSFARDPFFALGDYALTPPVQHKHTRVCSANPKSSVDGLTEKKARVDAAEVTSERVTTAGVTPIRSR